VFKFGKKSRQSSEFKFNQGSGGCSAITVFDMGEFVLLALAYSFAPLILLVLLLLLLLGAFFLALSVLLTAAFHQRSLPPVNWCMQTETSFFLSLHVLLTGLPRLTKEFFQASSPQGAGPPATARLGQLFLVWPSW
jgi:hypothetical protein